MLTKKNLINELRFPGLKDDEFVYKFCGEVYVGKINMLIDDSYNNECEYTLPITIIGTVEK